MRLLVLGSGAGGGLPQWNAPNENGRAAFGRDPLVSCRTQCSLAASLDGERWVVFNAAPDLRQQIVDNPQLHPRIAPRSTPIAAVCLTGAEIDQVAGLLTLRERQAFTVYGTSSTLQALAMNPIFDALHPDYVTRTPIAPGQPFEPVPGLAVTPIDIPGKAPLYLERTRLNPTDSHPGDAVAYLISDHRRTAVFAPGLAAPTPDLLAACDGADAILIDGTLFTDDEMMARGEGVKTGRRMGHMPMTGDGGTIEAFRDSAAGRRLFIHLNNTNPTLRAGSPERRTVLAAGWEIAEDRQEISL